MSLKPLLSLQYSNSLQPVRSPRSSSKQMQYHPCLWPLWSQPPHPLQQMLSRQVRRWRHVRLPTISMRQLPQHFLHLQEPSLPYIGKDKGIYKISEYVNKNRGSSALGDSCSFLRKKTTAFFCILYSISAWYRFPQVGGTGFSRSGESDYIPLCSELHVFLYFI